MYGDSEAEAGAVARFRVVADPGSQVLDTSSAWRNEALLRVSRRNSCWRRTCIAWRPWRGEERGGINLGLHEVTCLDRLVCVGDKGPDAGAAQATVTVAREGPAYWC
jgi:hypothetical protein